MADYGYRILRDACGKDSVPEVVETSWRVEDLKERMVDIAQDEIDALREDDGIDAVACTDEDHMVIEIRDDFANELISCYEIEEYEIS